MAIRSRAGLGLASALLALLFYAAASTAADRRDEVRHCAGRAATLVIEPATRFARGSHRGEVISGTSRPDRIIAGRGDDRLCGRGGRDRMHDGQGHDLVRGGSGRDSLVSAAGNDRLFAGPGRDRIDADDQAHDKVRGGEQADRIFADDGVRDRINCGPGKDTARVDSRDALKQCERIEVDPAPGFSLPPWSDGLWSDPSDYATIQTGDIDGDGDEEIIGRYALGVSAYDFEERFGQWMPLYVGGDPALTDASGYDAAPYYVPIQTADIDGDGADELLERDASGIEAFRYEPSDASWKLLPGRIAVSDASGWNQEGYYPTMQTADVNGDGDAEFFARSASGILVWEYQDGQWRDLPPGPVWGDPGGWGRPQYKDTIQAADINGDGSAEILARGADGMNAYCFTGTVWHQLQTNTDLGDGEGWGDDPSRYTTIQTADVNGDGDEELAGRSSDGLHVWSFHGPACGQGQGTWTALNGDPGFGDASGWNAGYYKTIQFGDVNGDGTEEVLARSAGGMIAKDYGPAQWTSLPRLADFEDDHDWGQDRYALTIQTADIGGGKAVELLGRGLTGVQTYAFDPKQNSWQSPSALFPQYVSGDTAAAYRAVNALLSSKAGFDVRTQYDEDQSVLAAYYSRSVRDGGLQCGQDQPPPAPGGVPSQAWATVWRQICLELGNAQLVAGLYGQTGYLQSVVEQIDLGALMGNVADYLDFEANSTQAVDVDPWSIIAVLFEGMTLFSEAPLVSGAAVVADLTAEAAALGAGAENVDNLSQETQIVFSRLTDELEGQFSSALAGIKQGGAHIQGDFGLQSAAARLIADGTWPAKIDNSEVIAGAQRALQLSAWKEILPVLGWAVIEDISTRAPTCTVRSYGSCFWNTRGAPHYCWLGGRPSCDAATGGWVWLSAATHVFRPIVTDGNSGYYQRLFDAPDPGCLKAWRETCSLGVNPADFFFGADGWDLQLWVCSNPCDRQR